MQQHVLIAVRQDTPANIRTAIRRALSRMTTRGEDADPMPQPVTYRHTASGTLWWVACFWKQHLRRGIDKVSPARLQAVRDAVANDPRILVQATDNPSALLSVYGMEPIETDD